MFRRESRAGAEIEPAETAPEPRAKAPAREPKFFTEGRTFAERKADADARSAMRAQRRLVSLGETEFAQRDTRTGQTEYLAAELFCDIDKPIERFVQIAGMPGMHPLHSVSGKEDTVVAIPGKVHARGPSQLTTPALPDPPPRPV